ncbi:hypothetical protein FA13DRAFT_1115100 [Coprinellus micaceus]|uniref:Uncharacterized protein n=1 Tax=Coprinellus micaceus TaxID=71717 RepID=A0A4Y7RJS5_COPMI|nr:hypothetical protein FA13DRAFT_1115100 [Coprinellus micaceus]
MAFGFSLPPLLAFSSSIPCPSPFAGHPYFITQSYKRRAYAPCTTTIRVALYGYITVDQDHHIACYPEKGASECLGDFGTMSVQTSTFAVPGRFNRTSP